MSTKNALGESTESKYGIEWTFHSSFDTIFSEAYRSATLGHDMRRRNTRRVPLLPVGVALIGAALLG